MRGFPETRWQLRQIDVPTDAETIAALIEDPVKVLGQLKSIRDETLIVTATKQIKRA